MALMRLMLFSLELKRSHPINEIADMLIRNNDERSRFLVSDFDDNHLDGHYCAIVTRNETVYNFEKGQVEKNAVDRTVFLQFSVDFGNKLILACGNSAIVSRFVTAMALCLNNEIVIGMQNVDLKKFVFQNADDRRFVIKKAKIADVEICDGILANCTIDVSQYGNISGFLKAHSNNISQIGVSALLSDSYCEDEEAISLSIYSSGNIVFHSSVDIFSDEWRKVIYKIWHR